MYYFKAYNIFTEALTLPMRYASNMVTGCNSAAIAAICNEYDILYSPYSVHFIDRGLAPDLNITFISGFGVDSKFTNLKILNYNEAEKSEFIHFLINLDKLKESSIDICYYTLYMILDDIFEDCKFVDKEMINILTLKILMDLKLDIDLKLDLYEYFCDKAENFTISRENYSKLVRTDLTDLICCNQYKGYLEWKHCL